MDCEREGGAVGISVGSQTGSNRGNVTRIIVPTILSGVSGTKTVVVI